MHLGKLHANYASVGHQIMVWVPMVVDYLVIRWGIRGWDGSDQGLLLSMVPSASTWVRERQQHDKQFIIVHCHQQQHQHQTIYSSPL